MTRPYFEETQSLKNSHFIWILMIVTSASAIIPMGYGLYWQIGKGEQWGDEPMPDEALIGLFIFVVICLAIMIICMAYSKLEVKIDNEGVHYRFVPYKFKWSMISRAEISTYDIKKSNSFLGICHMGYHRNALNNSRSMNLYGNKSLFLTLRNKRKLFIGTTNAEGAELAMRKLFNSNEMI